MAFPAPPESALTTPRFAFRHSMIPQPPSSKKESSPDDLSPKSVIADRRFISPASSSSSSIDRRNNLAEANHLKCQPRHDRGYSISDGEFSDPDSFLDSTSTSRDLGKVGNSEPLESLPETHSLALVAENANSALAVEMFYASTTSKLGDGESNCQLPLPSPCDGMDQSSEPIAHSILGERAHDSGRGDRGSQPPAVDQDDHWINPLSEWSQTSSSSESTSEQDGQEPSSRSSTRHRCTDSESRPRCRDYTSRPTFSAGLSTSGNPLEQINGTKRIPIGQGAANNFGYPGTPLRLFPGWSQAHSGTPIGSNAPALHSASPRIEKGVGFFSPASSADLPMGLRYHHRFHSGPITGSMIPKPPPSKWDDAEKWIVSPGHNEQSLAQPHHRPLQTLLTGRRHPAAGAYSFRSIHGAGSPDYFALEKPLSPQFENALVNAGKLEDGPILATSLKKRSKALSFGDLSRRFDSCRAAGKPLAEQEAREFREGEGQRAQVSLDAETNRVNEPILTNQTTSNEDQQAQSLDDKSKIAASIANTAYDGSNDSRISKHARSVSMNETSRVHLAVEQAVSFQEPATCRDMGTQMTPVESLRNSTCTTPGIAMTSPTRHNTPARSGRRASSLGAIPGTVDSLELQSCHLAKLELRKLAGDAPALDRNIVWITREEEERESAASLREDPEDPGRCQLASKAAKWEEAEKSKALLRYMKKEAEIKDWEEREKSQAEAEMKKIEAKAEKILAEANEKMKKKLALAAKKAAEKRAAAAAVRNKQSAKTAEKAELIRKTGRLSPPARSFFTRCFRF